MKTITYLSDTGCLEIQGASLLLNRVDTSTALDIEWPIIPTL
ncbi:tail fiber assembly protein [Escherichia coli]